MFDGVDDGAACYNLPILDDYTVISKREWIYPQFQTNNYFFNNNKAPSTGIFNMEFHTKDGYFTRGIGEAERIDPPNNKITYQTLNLYNNTKIPTEHQFTGTNQVQLGYTINQTGNLRFALYSLYLFDRSLPNNEIETFIHKYIDKDYQLPPSKVTPDCYYDFTNGDNNAEDKNIIKDLSGNNNHATAYNFAFNEEGSGYKDGALQFDGVDDYVALKSFTSGFKTIFMVVNPKIAKSLLYNQRKDISISTFAIFNGDHVIAYSARNNGVTYINGVLNKWSISEDFVNKKHCITIVNDKVNDSNSTTPILSINNEFIPKMDVYKFLGFKQALTAKQIKEVINNYNLLDGVDKI